MIERSLAFSNLSQKPYRTLCLSILVALSAAVLFGSLVLASSLKSGITGLSSSLGADLLVVPEGYEKGAENILLSGEPNYFYMERSVLDSVRELEEVESASPQFYLTSLSESCCDFPIQIIGFEPESDFTVKNWTSKKLTSRKLNCAACEAGGRKAEKENGNGTAKNGKVPAKEIILSGSNITLTGNSVRFFEETHAVTSRLSKSGSGMDNVIFCDLDTLQNIFDAARKKGFGFISDGDTKNKISTVLVRLSDGASADSTALKIKTRIPGVQVIQGEKFLRNFSKKIEAFQFFMYSISALVFLISSFSLALVFSITINERRREFSILRVLGANRSQLRKILFYEAFFLGSTGSVSGTALCALFILPFNVLISQKIALPFAIASVPQILIFAATVFVLCTASCLAASLTAVFRITKIEPYGDVK